MRLGRVYRLAISSVSVRSCFRGISENVTLPLEVRDDGDSLVFAAVVIMGDCDQLRKLTA